jgi:hypothetical protein
MSTLKRLAADLHHKILAEHGEQCGTFKAAKEFLADRGELVKKHSDGVNLNEVAEDNEWEFDQEADELEAEFLETMGRVYLTILSEEYDYLTSGECIRDTIIANEFTFTAEGERFG